MNIKDLKENLSNDEIFEKFNDFLDSEGCVWKEGGKVKQDFVINDFQIEFIESDRDYEAEQRFCIFKIGNQYYKIAWFSNSWDSEARSAGNIVEVILKEVTVKIWEET